MSEKLEKLRADLAKAKDRRIQLNNRNELLERRIAEAEKVEVSEMVRSANEKLEKLRADLAKAKDRRIQLNNRNELLERRIAEAEKVEVSEMVRSANLTPEQLAALLRQSANSRPGQSKGPAHPAEQPHRAAGTPHRRGRKGGGQRDGAQRQPHPGAAGRSAAAVGKLHPLPGCTGRCGGHI